MPYGRNINILNLDRCHRPSDMAHGFQQLLASDGNALEQAYGVHMVVMDIPEY